MSDAPAWTAVGISLMSFGYAEMRVRQRTRRLRAVGPLDEVRDALTSLRDKLDEVIANGGEFASFYLNEANKMTGQRVRDLIDRIEDRSLRREMGAAAGGWDQAFALAPPHGVLVSWGFSEDETPDQQRERAEEAARRQQQTEAARSGREAAQKAIDRANALGRRL